MSTSDERRQAAGCLNGEAKPSNRSANQIRPGGSSLESSNHNVAQGQADEAKVSGVASSKDLKKGKCKRKNKGKIHEEVPTITSEELADNHHEIAQQHNLHVVSPIEDIQVNQTSLSMHSSQLRPQDNQQMGCNLSSEQITIKKGVLWQQQDHDKLHQRLFSRWKKRFFILTTDYLVCFKRSTSKVGRSEMGRFLFKTSLGDILTVEWLRPKKSDKGAIILRSRNQSKLYLWTKDNLEDWMTQITAMRLKRKLRQGLADGLNHGKLRRVDNQNGIYENAALTALCDDRSLVNPVAPAENSDGPCPEGFQPSESQRTHANPSELHNVLNRWSAQAVNPNSLSDRNSIERIAQKGTNDNRSVDTGGNQTTGDDLTVEFSENQPARREVGPVARPPLMINDDRFSPGGNKPLRQEAKSSAGDDFVIEEQSARRHKLTFDQSAGSDTASKMSPLSSFGREESHGLDREALELRSARAICRDSNDNLVPMSFEQSESDDRRRSQDYSKRKLPHEQREKHYPVELGRDHSQEGQHSARNLPPDGVKMHNSIEVSEPPKRFRPAGNLIRRDDSWHSMLSLNHIDANQDSIRAHQASHGFPGANLELFQRHSSINKHIESTVTPLRERPFVRQQSMQINRNRVLPPNDQFHASSFDAYSKQNSTPIHGACQPPPTSYHQKLVQLQLLHNSNADYAQNRNEQQIYGPGSIATTNHYGYYSMRSNLRSAASEFSFIRPGSSNLNPSLPQVGAVQPPSVTNNFGDIAMDRPQFGPETRQQSMITPDWKMLLQNPNPIDSVNQMSPNGYGDLIAPSRDLPLKPNKKRPSATKDNQKGSSSAIGSGIVQFFRRAFSRRSKQRPRLAESCSSSLGLPFDDKFESMQRARSAFSTTEGNRSSNRGELIDPQQQATINQQHRMIDLIEAFANKTTIDRGTYDNLERKGHIGHPPAQISSPFRATMRNDISVPSQLVQYQQKPRNHIQQQVTNSPLHKSNSISTSTGLSGLNEMMRMNEHRMLVRESMSPSLVPMSGPRSSPLITRSTKVMSVNLTPVTSRREVDARDIVRNFDQQPPRPSSIYGQPSMISSPMSINGYDLRQNDFASRRAISHQQAQHMSPLNANLDLRRLHHQMKAPVLDTTREVAEEISTPTNESNPFLGGCASQNDSNSNEITTPRIRNSAQQQRQRPSRMVNPILQSPTMNFIYDNHPTPRTRNSQSSHYDNPRTLENQQSMSSMNLNGYTYERQQSDRRAAGEHEHQQRQSLYYCADVLSSQTRNYNPRQEHSDRARDQVNPLVTPSHGNVRLSHQSVSLDASYQNPDRPMSTYTKPSKMVYPSTPTNYQRTNEAIMEFSQPVGSHLVIDHRQLVSPSTSRAGLRPSEQMVWPSPIRAAQHQHAQQHQRSPLVNRHTRVLKRNDGVQATIIEPEVIDTIIQSDSKIRSATGSVDDKTSHGLLQKYGSSTTASNSSASSSLHSTDNQSNPNANKLLANSRAPRSDEPDVSKSDRQKMSNGNDQFNVQTPVRDDETSSRSASSGTDPISTSSSARSSSSVKRKSLVDSVGKSSRSSKGKRSGCAVQDNQQNKSSDGSRRSSSNENSDENANHSDVFNDHPSGGRNWVTSKLMQ